MSFWDPLSWDIFPTIELGPVSMSPHGIGIAVGFLAGAYLMVGRSKRFGGPSENDIWNTLFYALLGAIVGARVGYVIGHFSEVTDGGDDFLGIFKVWEGGISLLGGITGAVLAALPYVLKNNMGFWRTMDLAAPGLALGIVIGRIGDMIIGDHLGEPTDFPLAFLCTGESGGGEPRSAAAYRRLLESGDPPSLGCYDLPLHQTALYDFFSTLLLLGVLLWLGRKMRKPGFMILTFTVWYGAMRVITDFLRVDRRYAGLTGSQLLSIAVGLVCIYLLVRYRGAPPRFVSANQNPPPGGPPPEPGAGETPQTSDESGNLRKDEIQPTPGEGGTIGGEATGRLPDGDRERSE